MTVMNKELRLHHERRVIDRQVAIAKLHNFTKVIPGKYRKHHATDCGRPRCKLCGNSRRTWGSVTLQEVKANQKYAYDLSSVFEQEESFI